MNKHCSWWTDKEREMEIDSGVKLRDFIYLDVERVKSLLTQLDKGLLTDRSDRSETSTAVEARAGVTIPALLDVGGAGKYISTDQSIETRTLHDFVYTQTEEKLKESGKLTILPDKFPCEDSSDDIRSRISPVEYLLVRGKVEINDYEHMAQLITHFNEILRITKSFELQGVDKDNRHKINNVMQQELSAQKLDDKYVKDLLKLFDIFLKNRLEIRSTPFSSLPDLRVLGTLKRDYLRESLDDLRYKFGSYPEGEWVIFGQVASIPKKKPSAFQSRRSFSNPFAGALNNLFEATQGVEEFFRISYPDIAITPIAIYRE